MSLWTLDKRALLQHPRHIHPLKLLPRDQTPCKCDICGIPVRSSFCCAQCNFDVCWGCAQQTSRGPPMGSLDVSPLPNITPLPNGPTIHQDPCMDVVGDHPSLLRKTP